jgi:hypothetical protein
MKSLEGTSATPADQDSAASPEPAEPSRRQLLGGVATAAVSVWLASIAGFMLTRVSICGGNSGCEGLVIGGPPGPTSCTGHICQTMNCTGHACPDDLWCGGMNCTTNNCNFLSGDDCFTRTGSCITNDIDCGSNDCQPDTCQSEGPLMGGPPTRLPALSSGKEVTSMPYARSLATPKV